MLAHGQQTQPGATAADGSSDNSAQAPAEERPILHGDANSAQIAPQSQGAAQPPDLRGQMESLKSYLRGRRAFIEIPPTASAGWWPGFADSSVRLLDDRGNTLPDSAGNLTSGRREGFKTGWNNALLLRATETEPGPPWPYAGFINVQFHYTAAKGGVNNFNVKSGTKTDYFNVMASSEMRTVGQKTGISSMLSSFSGGDTMGIQSYITQYGGFDTSGDEQTEGLRVQAQQGAASKGDSGGVFEGVVSGIQGDVLTYTPAHDENTIGEHRLIRNLDRVYSTGSIAAIANSGGSPNTVRITGSGTSWSSLGRTAHTQWNDLSSGGSVTQSNLAFCFDPLRNDGYDVCFPVSAILDDTHLTLNLYSTGPAQNTPWPGAWPVTGSYRIYVAAWPTTVDIAAHTLTADALTGFAKGNRIDQVFAYNTEITGAMIVLRRHIGLPIQGGGINIQNVGTPNSPRMESGIGMSGGFESAIAFQRSNQLSGPPNYFATLYTDPGSRIIFDSAPARTPSPEVGMWRIRDASGAPHIILSFLRATATTCVLDTFLCVSANGSVAARQLGQSEANDYAGTISVRGGSSAQVTFRQPFKSAPVCTLTPTSDPSGIGTYWVSSSATGVTANVRQSGSISFNYICIGNPD
jgi:hypothetical protein